MGNKKALIVIDMQNDFLSGALRNEEGLKVISYIKEKLEKTSADTKIIFTRDTHSEDYMHTEEGANLPVEHCFKGTEGWQIVDDLKPFIDSDEANVVDKDTFGSRDLLKFFEAHKDEYGEGEIELVGVCTDICVISNALLIKAALPNAKIFVDAKGCAGVTPKSHDTAIEAMKACHIHIKNEGEESWR
jgi:nicotinamidase-related amidase